MKHYGPLFLILAALGLFLYWRNRSAPGGTPVPQSEPQDTSGPASIDVSSDLSGYPIHGAPAFPLSPGSKDNYFADTFAAGGSAQPGQSQPGSVTPASHTPLQPFSPELFAGSNDAIRQALAGLPIGPINTHASSGFGSDQFKLTDFLNQIAAIPVAVVDYIGQSLGFPPPAKIVVRETT